MVETVSDVSAPKDSISDSRLASIYSPTFIHTIYPKLQVFTNTPFLRFNHGRNINASDPILIPLPADDPWRPGMDMVNIPRTTNDRKGSNASMPTTYPNKNTHWWDLR